MVAQVSGAGHRAEGQDPSACRRGHGPEQKRALAGLPQPGARGSSGCLGRRVITFRRNGPCEWAGVQVSVWIAARCYSRTRTLDLRTFNRWNAVRWLSPDKATSVTSLLLNYTGTDMSASVQMSVFLLVSLWEQACLGSDHVVQTRHGPGRSTGWRLLSCGERVVARTDALVTLTQALSQISILFSGQHTLTMQVLIPKKIQIINKIMATK